MPRWKFELPLLVAVFLDLLGFGMVIAGFQLRAERIVPEGWPQGPIIGALLASTFVLQLIVSPWWGRRSDVYGRKPILVACTVLSALAMLVYGVADNLLLMLLSRILAGFGAANVAVAQAYLSDVSTGEERTASLGRVGAALSSGLVIGPVVGGLLAKFGGTSSVGLVGGFASLAGAIYLAIALPEEQSRERQQPGKRPAVDLSLLKETPRLRPLVLLATVAWFSLATLEGTFARLINRLFNYGELEFGILFGYESLVGVAVQGVLLAFLVKRFRDVPLLRWAYIAQGVGLALNPLAGEIGLTPFVLLLVASTLFAVGSSIANPTLNGLCSKLTPDARQGELFGLLQGARAVGFIIGPIAGGALFDWGVGAPYYIAGLVCLAAAFIVPMILRGGTETEAANAAG